VATRPQRSPAERLKDAARWVLPELVYRPIRTRRVARTVERYETRIVHHRYGGRDRAIVIADPLAEGWYDHDWAEPAEIALLARHRLRRGATVFDLGAHQAIVALMLADHVGGDGRVVAVEAEPHNVAVARRNVELNRASNVRLVHAAVARAPGSVRFSPGLNGRVASQHRLGTVAVRAVSVDELAREHGSPDVLFIDIEGHELEALRGAPDTLAGTPDLYVEVHTDHGLTDAGGSAEEVVELVAAAGYDDLLVAPLDGEFRPWRDRSPLPEHHFLLVAYAGEATGQPGTPRA
jgi:FkbM family methyltransferase